MIKGVFNVIIVGNSEFESKDDQSAYRRRFRWIRCKNFKPQKVIPNLARKKFSEEGFGILNRALNGAKNINI
jgi:hypothetical protein